MKSELVHIVAHDFRSPLAGILGYALLGMEAGGRRREDRRTSGPRNHPLGHPHGPPGGEDPQDHPSRDRPAGLRVRAGGLAGAAPGGGAASRCDAARPLPWTCPTTRCPSGRRRPPGGGGGEPAAPTRSSTRRTGGRSASRPRRERERRGGGGGGTTAWADHRGPRPALPSLLARALPPAPPTSKAPGSGSTSATASCGLTAGASRWRARVGRGSTSASACPSSAPRRSHARPWCWWRPGTRGRAETCVGWPRAGLMGTRWRTAWRRWRRRLAPPAVGGHHGSRVAPAVRGRAGGAPQGPGHTSEVPLFALAGEMGAGGAVRGLPQPLDGESLKRRSGGSAAGSPRGPSVREVLEAALGRGGGEAVALVTLVATEGSTPRKAGARMLVQADGRISARSGAAGWRPIWRPGPARRSTPAARSSSAFDLTTEQAGRTGSYAAARCRRSSSHRGPPLLPVRRRPRGGGAGPPREGLRLPRGGGRRPASASRERYPEADRRGRRLRRAAEQMRLGPRAYAVVATRGFEGDASALVAVLARGSRFVGVLGSRTKVAKLRGARASGGFARRRWPGSHAPWGWRSGLRPRRRLRSRSWPS